MSRIDTPEKAAITIVLLMVAIAGAVGIADYLDGPDVEEWDDRHRNVTVEFENGSERTYDNVTHGVLVACRHGIINASSVYCVEVGYGD